jgi:hypothetical protein
MNLTRSYGLLFVLALAGVRCFADDPAPMQLAVVHTWGDLQAQKSVALANDSSATCWLGIDCSDAKLYGGAVLYCLAKGGKPPARTRDGLGPFQVEVQTPSNRPRAQMAAQSQYMGGQSGTPVGQTLYQKAIPLSQAGDYTITVKELVGDAKDQKFETVAVATITVSNESGPIWSPWPLNAADGAVGLLAWDDDRAYSAIGVANPSTGVSIPMMPASVEIEGTLPASDAPLPRLLPEQPDPKIKLQVSGALLIVTLDHAIQPKCVDEKFLSRWWINGKPFVPKLEAPAFSMFYSMRHNGMVPRDSATEVGFQVEFHPEILGAKKGDTVGVQLLLCPIGSEYAGPEPGEMPEIGEGEFGNMNLPFWLPRMSNRVTFIYTGDPVRMAPLAVSSH